MRSIELSYNPYTTRTVMMVDKTDVRDDHSYDQFREFLDNGTPLQTWIEPIEYLQWPGFVNGVADPEVNDEIKIIFSGRKIDFDDLCRSINKQNNQRSERTRIKFHFTHKKVLDDKVLSKNIEHVVKELKSDRFKKLVEERTTVQLRENYAELDKNYTIAKQSEFYIVFAGVYSSGKSTLLNTLIHHDILTTSDDTCTSKNCRIKHDSSLGQKVSLQCMDANGKVVVPKQVFANDIECARRFTEISPIKGNNPKYANVCTIELGADLSHLYPDSVTDDKFTIVLIDTPGMDSAASSEDGVNRHAELALDAINDPNKPMIILCADALKYQDKSIGEFMSEILAHASKGNGGFNDRFLFIMNKSDALTYKGKDESPEKRKAAFAEYLTDSSKWGIEIDNGRLKELADQASRFVPRVFMTTARTAYAIQKEAYDFSDEDLDDEDNENLFDSYEDFRKKICDRKRLNYYLSNYCDIPQYRKEELNKEFEEALDQEDDVRATQLQCGLVSVESAIKDYVERYAFPVKVRGLMETFEAILDDVNGFTGGILDELNRAQKSLGENERARKGATDERLRIQEKIAALQKAKKDIEIKKADLSRITFDSTALKRSIGDFRADIESDTDVRFIRSHEKVETGGKSESAVKQEIESRISRIKNVFNNALARTNKKMEETLARQDKDLATIFGYLKDIVTELERSGVLEYGKFSFTRSVLWKKTFSSLDTNTMIAEVKKTVVGESHKTVKKTNWEKVDWETSWNPFKRIGAWFMDDDITTTETVSGYYKTTAARQSIDKYLNKLNTETNTMETQFRAALDTSKKQVLDLINLLIRELDQFHQDIQTQERRITELSGSIAGIQREIARCNETKEWLNQLTTDIEGV